MKVASFACALAVGFGCFAQTRTAHAQSFDTVTWTPLTRSGGVVTDAPGPSAGERDVVGDAANVAAHVTSDATALYLRVRVNDKPTNADGTFKGSLWGCVVDTDGVLTTYEYLVILDGQDSVHWRFNGSQSIGSNVVTEPAETLVGTAPRTTHARAVDALSSPPFSGDWDWFVELAMPWTIIRAGGSGAPKVAAGTPMRFVCGTSALTFDLSSDHASTAASGALDLAWSDPYVCATTGCVVDTTGIKPPMMDAGPDAATFGVDAGRPTDAGSPVEAGLPPPAGGEGGFEGTGLICAASWPVGSRGSPGAPHEAALLALAAAATIAIKLRRSR